MALLDANVIFNLGEELFNSWYKDKKVLLLILT